MYEIYKVVVKSYRLEAQQNTKIDKVLYEFGIITEIQFYNRVNQRMLVFSVLKIGLLIILFADKK